MSVVNGTPDASMSVVDEVTGGELPTAHMWYGYIHIDAHSRLIKSVSVLILNGTATSPLTYLLDLKSAHSICHHQSYS